MMKQKVIGAVKRFSLLSGNEKKVVVALSGGADSMSLLHLLISLREELSLTVEAAHFNHMIRGSEADRDEAFVKEKCRQLGIKLYCESADVPKYARENSLSHELAARKLRYEFLDRVSGDSLVATAHTASDNLETVIFNLARGTSLDGLCGIPAKRGKYIRPLILCTRAEVEDYCEKNSIEYVTDSTNLSDDYSRNSIRHNIVPYLKAINPSVEKTVMRMSEHLKSDSDYLSKKADEELKKRLTNDGGLLLDGFENIAKAVAFRVLKGFAEEKKQGMSLESVHIESIYSDTVLSGVKTSLPLDFYSQKIKGILYIKSKSGIEKTDFPIEIIEEDYKKDCKIHNLLLKNLIDCDKIVGKLAERTRQPGDSIRLKNRGCTKTLNKIFNEEGVSPEIRDRLPVLCDEKGIVWVYGIGVAERCAVTDSSKKILRIKI